MGERKNGGWVVGEEEEGMVGRAVEGDEEGKVRWGEERDNAATRCANIRPNRIRRHTVGRRLGTELQ